MPVKKIHLLSKTRVKPRKRCSTRKIVQLEVKLIPASIVGQYPILVIPGFKEVKLMLIIDILAQLEIE